MPIYHFHVYDDVGGDAPDREGTDLSDAVSAEREAVRFAGEVITDNARLNRYGGNWHLKVTNDTGALLFRLDFVIKAVPESPPPQELLTSAAYRHIVGVR